VDSHLQGRLDVIREMSESDDDEKRDELYDYGLDFGYVEPNTFDDQLEGYYRWQLSWGGPGDEFRVFVNPDKSIHRIEYWFLDWYDGAHLTLKGDNFDLINGILSDWVVGHLVESFNECVDPTAVYRRNNAKPKGPA